MGDGMKKGEIEAMLRDPRTGELLSGCAEPESLEAACAIYADAARKLGLELDAADFEAYFRLFSKYLKLRPGQQLHCEPGRSIVAQCGSLITKVTYVKKGKEKQFAIVDAGMTDLIRPALYQAYHRIENISSDAEEEKYDVVGPICESSDVFDKDVLLNGTKRGDYLSIRSSGAYGEIMASGYNLRRLPKGYLSTEF